MSDTTRSASEQEELEMLLPWYATGKLDRADAARVAAFLAERPDMARQLGLIREEQDETIRANELLGAPPAAALDRLMAQLPPVRASLSQRVGHLWEAIESFFQAPSAGAVRWTAVAAAAIIVVQFAAVGALLVERGQDRLGYQTASGPGSQSGIAALIGFTESAPAAAITRLLAEFEASVVDGPKPGGLYKIRLRAADTSELTKKELLRRLAERRDVVKFVLPSND